MSIWSSPISVASMGGDYRLYDVQWDNLSDTLIWQERRSGGSALVIQSDGTNPRDLLRDESVGGRVLYGGGGFTVANGMVYYAGRGGRIYRLALSGGMPRPVTPAFGDVAAPTLSPDDNQLLYVHSYEGRDALVLAPADGSQYPRKLIDNTDFVMHPAWHPDGELIACVTWDHPHMPWDASQLQLYRLSDGERHIIAGENNDESVFGAAFSPDGRFLAYASDREGWWQIYLYDVESGSHTRLTEDEAEYGLPAWIQDMRTFAWAGDTIYALRNADSAYTLQRVDISSGTMTQIAGLDAYTHMEQIAVSPVTGEVAFIAGASQIPDRIVTVNPDSGEVKTRAYSSTEAISTDYLSKAENIAWEIRHGITVNGLYYPPTNPRYNVDTPPPLIVNIHSGPTRQRFNRYFPEVHFFTSRGFAVLEPNYRGSTGYGRDFKNMLHGNWGIAEVEDSARGAEYLAGLELVNREKLIVMGESSGGLSALQALILMPSVFCAAIAQAPVTDQIALSMETHKFERHYNDSLLGNLPEAASLYRERSPLLHANRISDPVALFHGQDDNVVPINQSEGVAAALRRNGVPHVYKTYAGEGHSFRQPETQRDYYQTILDFLLRYVVYV